MADTKRKEFVLGFWEPKEGEPPGLVPFCEPPSPKFLEKIQIFRDQVEVDPKYRRWEIRTSLTSPHKITIIGKVKDKVPAAGLRIIAIMGANAVRKIMVQNLFIRLQAHEMLCDSLLPKLDHAHAPMEVEVLCDTEDNAIVTQAKGKRLIIRVPKVDKTEFWGAWAEEERLKMTRQMALTVLDTHGLGTPA